MVEYDAYRSAERAELYDAVYSDAGDEAFWTEMAQTAGEGPILELGCGTGRILLSLAQAGRSVTGLDLAPHMLARCRSKLEQQPAAVRERVTVLEADMASFNLDRGFADIYCAFGSFHHLRTVEEQLSCLESCLDHLLPGGRLVLDLINPDPEPGGDAGADATRAEPSAKASELAARSGGDREVRGTASVVGTHRALQCNDCEVTYEITESDGSTRQVTESFPMRFIFRYELEHLLARCGFDIVTLYGDYDRSTFADDSLGMIAVARRSDR